MSNAITNPTPSQLSDETGEAEQLSRFQLPEDLVQVAMEHDLPVEDLMISAKYLWIKTDPNGLELAETPMVFGAITDAIVEDDQVLLNSTLDSLNAMYYAEDSNELLERFRWRIFNRLSFEIGVGAVSDIFGSQLAGLADKLDEPRSMQPRDLLIFCKTWYEFIQQLDYHRGYQPTLAEMMAYYRSNCDAAMAGFETWKQATTKHYARLLEQE